MDRLLRTSTSTMIGRLKEISDIMIPGELPQVVNIIWWTVFGNCRDYLHDLRSLKENVPCTMSQERLAEILWLLGFPPRVAWERAEIESEEHEAKIEAMELEEQEAA